MQFSIAKDELVSALGPCASIASKSGEAYLACVLVTAKDGDVSFSASDNDQMVRISRQSLVTDKGSALIPAAKLYGIVKSMPNGAVTVDTSDEARITSHDVSFSLPLLNPLDFPNFPRVEDPQTALFDADEFVGCFSAAAKFAKRPEKNETMPILTSIRVDAENGEAHVGSTDSYRIARMTIKAEGDLSCEIPANFVTAIAADNPSGKIRIKASGSLVSAEYDDTYRVTRRVTSGKYPNLPQFFKSEPTIEFEIPVDALKGATHRLLMIESRSRPARFTISDRIEIAIDGEDRESYSELVDADNIVGEGMFKVSPRYVADAAKEMQGDIARVRIESPQKPLRFTSQNLDIVIMPVR